MLLASFAAGEPHMKETMAMIRAGQNFVEVADSELLERLDLGGFVSESLCSYVETIDPAERMVRLSNLGAG